MRIERQWVLTVQREDGEITQEHNVSFCLFFGNFVFLYFSQMKPRTLKVVKDYVSVVSFLFFSVFAELLWFLHVCISPVFFFVFVFFCVFSLFP